MNLHFPFINFYTQFDKLELLLSLAFVSQLFDLFTYKTDRCSHFQKCGVHKVFYLEDEG